MFLGAVEIDTGITYMSDNTLTNQINDNNIVIVEYDFIFHDLIDDSVTFTDSIFHIATWNTAKKESFKRVVKVLVFENKTTLTDICELLVNRVQYMYKMHNYTVTKIHTKCEKSSIVMKTKIEN